MAIHTGVEIERAPNAGDGLPVEMARGYTEEITAETDKFEGIASFLTRSPVSTGTTKQAVATHNYGTEQIYERLWFKPIIINAGFIVDDIVYNISIWNAYQATDKEITAIVPINATGTTLETGAIPETLTPTEETIHFLTVLQSGPVDQATIYLYLVSGQGFLILVSGTRVQPFPFDIQWATDVKLTYKMETVIDTTKRLIEQRRPMLPRFYRDESFDFFAQETEAQKLTNVLSFAHNKVIGVPVYAEGMTTTTDIQGAATLDIIEDIGDYFNLQSLTENIILLDYASGIATIKVLSSIGGGSLTFTSEITEAFDKATTLIFPVMLAYIDSVAPKHKTPTLTEVSLNFKELVLG